MEQPPAGRPRDKSLLPPVSEHYEVFFTDPPQADLSPEYAGKEKCAPGHCWQGVRNHFLIHYVLRGNGLVRTSEGQQLLGAGDGFLFFPGQQSWYRADRLKPWTYAWVGFSGRQAENAVRQIGFSEERTVWRAPPSAPLRKLFRRLAEPAPLTTPLPSLRSTGLLYLLLDEIGSLMKPGRPQRNGRQSGAIERAYRFVELHSGQGITVSDMARHVAMERTYFSTFFRRETGSSPSRYLRAYRMARAERLLAETSLRVKEIASLVGYPDYFVFAKMFRRMHGCTPSEFRTRNSPAPPVPAGRGGS